MITLKTGEVKKEGDFYELFLDSSEFSGDGIRCRTGTSFEVAGGYLGVLVSTDKTKLLGFVQSGEEISVFLEKNYIYSALPHKSRVALVFFVKLAFVSPVGFTRSEGVEL